ncbi:lytic transglycosylase domain-containing protein [Christiangramia sp. SM2212]|uniref:LysM peptidoglycan-binding domain-containing protein n=1 Tax=Christiangramia sediminicola TaxID=3073267 RepID=A0ABU1ESJ1_9FLAO|nr:LysM peptidoglycan-binding domain-containing protein [Christiangramia sp. SM2212]MDR5591374.1 LysM peptidoglycan-binding domain-containing protein [Christiangramia sp. SM2212]
MLIRKLLMLLILVGVSALGQEKKNKERVEKANFRVQIFQKSDDTEIKLAEPDPEFRDKLPISAVIRDSSKVKLADLPKAKTIDSLWKTELTNSDLYESMQKSIREQDYEDVVYKELPTDTLKARLAKLNARTPFNVEYNPILESVIKSYLKRNKQGMERLMALSRYYFPMFEQELDKYDIPLEIKYLAIVESALNPRAKSRVGATGLWQFMFTTGKMHGLDVSSYVDERMDPERSTEAAAQYLASLYKVFGDWDLVLASYNSGPGNVSKAIRRSGGSTDYWHLRRFLPRETAGYVPAFLATLYLFEYADEHKFQPSNPDVVYFETDTIHVKQLLSFDQITKVTGVEKEMLQFLNPSYKLDIIPFVEDERYSLRLPKPATGKFVSNENAIYDFAKNQLEEEKKELPKYVETEDRIRYRVRSGDYLGKIAEKYGVGISSIKRWNNMRSNNLRVGQYLTIYPRKPVEVASGSGSSNSSKSSNPRFYTVRQGDSLWSISKKFPGVTVQNLRSWNDMNTNSLKPGMKLKLSKG